MRPSRVWYLAYGSNINANRFRLYLEGGVKEPGARDATPPERSRFVRAPLRLSFALESQRWNGGGVAFVTPVDELPEPAWAWLRAWDITSEQFEDVYAQENRGRVGTTLPWDQLLSQPVTDIGDRWYRRVLRLDVPELETETPGQPALTFTWAAPAPPNPPDAEYRATIATGLDDHPPLDPSAINDYLDAATIAE